MNILHLCFQWRYFFLLSTASCPFHLTKSCSFLLRSASSSSVHSYLLSPAYVRSRCSRFPETRSSFLTKAGRVVWYYLASTFKTDANSATDNSFWGSDTLDFLSASIILISNIILALSAIQSFALY